MASTSIQRLRGGNKKTQGKAGARIDISVQSVDYPRTKSITASNKKSAFIRTMSEFYALVSQDFNRTSSRATLHLEQTYACDKVTVYTDDATLTFDVVYDGRHVVGLQCDQSSGQLARDLQRCLVTDAVLRRLNVEALRLGVELRRKT